jgi:hypothetical protein
MTSASEGEERGIFRCPVEEIGASLDISDDDVISILNAMTGRFIEGNKILSWEKRQPKREDGAAERAKAWRERKRTQANASERPDKEADTDTDIEKKISKFNTPSGDLLKNCLAESRVPKEWEMMVPLMCGVTTAEAEKLSCRFYWYYTEGNGKNDKRDGIQGWSEAFSGWIKKERQRRAKR